MIKKGKGKGMLSESTLSTSSTVCQFHCSEPEILIARPPSSSLPPSPTSALLYLDSNQTTMWNNRRKQMDDLD